MTKIFLGCDHAAFEAKEQMKTCLKELGHEVQDLGTHSSESCHYPVFAKAVAEHVQQAPESLGVLLCGSGIGVSMVANKYKHVRAATCHDPFQAKLSRQHNNSNVLCLGARVTTPKEQKEIVKAWLETSFEGGRHLERVQLFDELGE